MLNYLRLTALLILTSFFLPELSNAVTYMVTNLNDAGPGSLRQAIIDSNATTAVDDEIVFQEGLSGTIPSDVAFSGQMDITDDVTIIGPGADVITIDAQDSDNIFNINDGEVPQRDVHINGLRFINATGAVINVERLVMDSCVFEKNGAEVGAAINNREEGRIVLLSNTKFIMNDSLTGSGVHNAGTINDIVSCEFNMNTSVIGGGINNVEIIDKIEDCTFDNNIVAEQGGAIKNDGTIFLITDSKFIGNKSTEQDGGAIHNSGVLTTLTKSEFTGNMAVQDGGAIVVENILNKITKTTFKNNSTTGDGSDNGGAIYIPGPGNLNEIDECTFDTNSAVEDGGAIFIFGEVEKITNSTFVGNTAVSDGGAIANDGSLLQMYNSTFSGNMVTDGRGGAIFNSDTINTSFITVTNNEAPTGSGIGGSGNTNISSSIVAFNIGSDNCDMALIDMGNNFSDDMSCGFGTTLMMPGELGPLANNGGPTQTAALIDGPAVNGADPDCKVLDDDGNPSADPLTVDQRGFIRPSGPACDSGAFETQPYPPLINGQTADKGVLDKNQKNKIKLTGITPNGKANLLWGFKRGSGNFSTSNCGNIPLGISPKQTLAKFRANGSGMVTKVFKVPSSSENKAFLQVVDLSNCGAGPVIEVILSN